MRKLQYFRNKEAITVGFVHIDAHSLWRLDGDYLVLVDDDQFIQKRYEPNKDLFDLTSPDDIIKHT